MYLWHRKVKYHNPSEKSVLFIHNDIKPGLLQIEDNLHFSLGIQIANQIRKQDNFT